MTINMNSISKIALLLLLSFSISACGGKKKAVSSEVVDTNDITRPPTVEIGSIPVDEAVAEGETVSFDEWRKRREAQKRKLEQDQ